MIVVDQTFLAAEEPDVQELFDYWFKAMGKRKNTVLGPNRRARLRWSLKHYGLDACKLAVDGCTKSPSAMGRNRGRRKYNDILDIFRNEKTIEDYIELADRVDLDESDDW